MFFAFTFADPERPVLVRLNRPGVVELTSGAGDYWLRAYVLVSETPYCAVTDRQGAFCLAAVPAGEYEVECWLPNWDVARRERDPETGVVTRLDFGPPHRATRPARVEPRGAAEVHFALPASPDDVEVR